jgi:hypothetical protein
VNFNSANLLDSNFCSIYFSLLDHVGVPTFYSLLYTPGFGFRERHFCQWSGKWFCGLDGRVGRIERIGRIRRIGQFGCLGSLGSLGGLCGLGVLVG